MDCVGGNWLTRAHTQHMNAAKCVIRYSKATARVIFANISDNTFAHLS